MRTFNKKSVFLGLFSLLFIFQLFSQSNKPYAKNININVDEKKFEITWENPISSNISRIYIFSDTKPITSSNQLIKENLVANLPASSTNFITTNKNFYSPFYAIIYQLSDSTFYNILIFGENTTLFNNETSQKIQDALEPSVLIDEKESLKNEEELLEEGELRATPLPLLGLNKQEGFISKDIQEKNISVIPYIFDEEKEENPFGTAYELYRITSTFFPTEKYDLATKELILLLETKHNEKITGRIYFYLGECYFFQGQFKEALGCFLLSEKQYPVISKQWQQYVLNKFSF